jgi:hypothetical protein
MAGVSKATLYTGDKEAHKFGIGQRGDDRNYHSNTSIIYYVYIAFNAYTLIQI